MTDNKPRCVVDMKLSNPETEEYAVVPGWFDFDLPIEGKPGFSKFFQRFDEGMIMSTGGVPENWVLFGAVNARDYSAEEVAKALSIAGQMNLSHIDIDLSNSG